MALERLEDYLNLFPAAEIEVEQGSDESDDDFEEDFDDDEFMGSEKEIGFEKYETRAFLSLGIGRLCCLSWLAELYANEEDLYKNIRESNSPEKLLSLLNNCLEYCEDYSIFMIEARDEVYLAKHFTDILIDYIPPYQRDRRSAIIDWANIHCQNWLKCGISLALEGFPFGDSTRKWFHLTEGETKGATTKRDIGEVDLINLEGREDDNFESQTREQFLQGLIDNEHIILYHGTVHGRAKSILFTEIDLTHGGAHRDFSSDGNGFYLTDRFEDALDWSFKMAKSSMNPAILIYRVEEQWLREGSPSEPRCYLDLRNDNVKKNLDWNTVVCHFIGREKDKKLTNKLKKYEFIEGPISDIDISRLGQPINRNRATPMDDTYQICLKDEKLAENFSQKLHSIIFYNKYIQ